MIMIQKIFFPLIAVLLPGCALIPDYHTPEVPRANNWSQPTELMASDVTADWWKQFNSVELNDFMQQALTENNDLLASLQRIEQSRASLKIARADLFPSIGLSATTSNSKLSGNASSFSTNDAIDFSTSGLGGNSRRNQNLSAGANVSYEVDLFGRVRSSVASSEATLEGAKYDSDALRLVVMGDVASSYFTVINARERLGVADRNIAISKDVLRIVQAQFDAGRTSALELAQQTSALASAEAARAFVEKDIYTSENALAVLLGHAPQTISVATENLDNITLPVIAISLPSELLQRRPDIAAAEARLRAANANIGAARAVFFPTLSLGAGATVSAETFSGPATQILSLTSSIIAPIFEGGRIEGGVELANAQKLELVENYRKAVLVAFQEVEDALASEKVASLRETSLKTALSSAQTSYDLSKQRYEAGSIDFQTLLDTQATLLTAETSYTVSRLDRLNAAITLYKALGGGWRQSAEKD